MVRQFIGLLTLGVAFAALSADASAQAFPVPYAGPVIAANEIQGTVHAFSPYRLDLRADWRDVTVDLHHGTVLQPTGLTLIPGMFVRVRGYWSNGTFIANRIVLLR